MFLMIKEYSLIDDSNADIETLVSKQCYIKEKYKKELYERVMFLIGIKPINQLDIFTKNYLSKNSNDYSILRILSCDNDYFVKINVARNRSCSLYILQDMFYVADLSLRKVILTNPNISEYLLRKFSLDKHWAIRRAVADNLSCPLNILEKLSIDKDYLVRAGVALNPNCPKHILEKLANNKNEHVREMAGE